MMQESPSLEPLAYGPINNSTVSTYPRYAWSAASLESWPSTSINRTPAASAQSRTPAAASVPWRSYRPGRLSVSAAAIGGDFTPDQPLRAGSQLDLEPVPHHLAMRDGVHHLHRPSPA
jgi:hypothetical protein